MTVVTAHFNSKLISYHRQTAIVTGSQWQPDDEGERLRYAGHAINLRTAASLVPAAS